MVGGSGNDRLSGDPRSDHMRGEEGRDIVDGDSGSDRLFGEAGPDWLNMGDFGEVAKNTLSGGDGDDALIAINRPARRDIVSCGGGFDRVVADTKDQVASDCERVRRGPTSEQEIDALFVELGFRKVDEGLAPDPTRSTP
jgi:Ca2+-binding RTX toxin-like protein